MYQNQNNPQNQQNAQQSSSSSSRSGRTVVPEAKGALNQMKYEIASELGINLKQGYNGDLPSRQAGYIGGYMTKRLIEQAERSDPRTPRAIPILRGWLFFCVKLLLRHFCGHEADCQLHHIAFCADIDSVDTVFDEILRNHCRAVQLRQPSERIANLLNLIVHVSLPLKLALASRSVFLAKREAASFHRAID